MELLKQLKINNNSVLPKYKLIANSISQNILNENLKTGDKLPSINCLIHEFEISRRAAVKAYEILKSKKLICSSKYKGYYVSNYNRISKINILFLINKLGSYEMKIYNGFVNTLGTDYYTDLQIYNYNEELFVDILNENLGAYDFYVIIPHFKNAHSEYKVSSHKINRILEDIPTDKLVLIDNNIELKKREFKLVFQDFKKDIYNSLRIVCGKLRMYSQIVLVYSHKSIYPSPIGILNGFIELCSEFNFKHEILDEVNEDIVLKKRDLFIVLEDKDLINLVKQVRNYEFELGSEVGIVAYHDSPLKELLGISTLSANYYEIGKRASELIMKGINVKETIPFSLMSRKSF